MQVLVIFRLSNAGRKACLLAGRDASEIQTISVPIDAPGFAEVVQLGSMIGHDCRLDTTERLGTYSLGVPATEWDHMPTVDELLIDHARRDSEMIELLAAAKEKKLNETLAVLTERKTRKESGSKDGVYYYYEQPDWPYNSDAEVIGSPEAKAWLAELDAAKEVAFAEAKAKHDAEKAARLAAEEEAKQKDAERRKRLGLREGENTWAVEHGCLTECPNHSSHKRSKNWMAVITVNPRSPGGLDRDFCEKAHGDAFYVLPSSLAPGDALEFGADYYSGSGRKSADRWYGYVVRIEEGYIVLKKCSTGKDAVKAGEKHAAKLAESK